METYSGLKVTTFRERFIELCDSDPKNDSGIANALHVSRQTVCSWKSGARSPRQPTIVSIANYFNVDIAWLMGFDVEKEAKPTHESNIIALKDSKELVKLITAMTPEDYTMVMAAIDRTYKRLKAEGKM